AKRQPADGEVAVGAADVLLAYVVGLAGDFYAAADAKSAGVENPQAQLSGIVLRGQRTTEQEQRQTQSFHGNRSGTPPAGYWSWTRGRINVGGEVGKGKALPTQHPHTVPRRLR